MSANLKRFGGLKVAEKRGPKKAYLDRSEKTGKLRVVGIHIP
jgi:hypothetical protein